MAAHHQFVKNAQFASDCNVIESDGSILLEGSFRVKVALDPSLNELDQIVELADAIGQLLKANIATNTLEHADKRAAHLAQTIAPHVHKHGSRPFTIITPFGRLKTNRTRLFDSKTGKTSIPSAILWNTKQNRHIVTSLAQSACDTSQNISYRKSQTAISETALTDSLLAHSTLWKIKQNERQHLEAAQQKFVDDVLKKHDKTLEKNGFLPPPSSQKTDIGNNIDENVCSGDIEEEANAMYQHFTSEVPKIKELKKK